MKKKFWEFWLMSMVLSALLVACGGGGAGEGDDDDNDNNNINGGKLWDGSVGCGEAEQIACGCAQFEEFAMGVEEKIKQDTGEEVSFCEDFEDIFVLETMCYDVVMSWAWSCYLSHPSFGSRQSGINYAKELESCPKFGEEVCSLDRSKVLECSDVDGKWHVIEECDSVATGTEDEMSEDELCIVYFEGCEGKWECNNLSCDISSEISRIGCVSMEKMCVVEGEKRKDTAHAITDNEEIEVICVRNPGTDTLMWQPVNPMDWCENSSERDDDADDDDDDEDY